MEVRQRPAEDRYKELAAEREQLLAEMDAQRKLLQSVLENVPAGIVLLRGPDYTIEYANPGMLAMTPNLRLGQPLSRAAPILWPQLEPVLTRVWQTGEPFHGVEVPYRVRPAPERPEMTAYFTYSAVLKRGLAGQPEAVVVLVIDSTAEVRDRRRVEELARLAQQNAAELRTVLDTMVEGVMVFDREGRATLVNPASARLLGTGMAQKLLEDLQDQAGVLPLRHLDGTPVRLEESLVTQALAGKTMTNEARIAYSPQLKHDVHLRGSAVPMRDDRGQIHGALVVYRDVTELAEMAELRDEFVSNTAHELKTPVATVKGYAQMLLRRRAELPEGTAAPLEAIDRGANRMARIIEDLLLGLRLRAGELQVKSEPVDLTALAHTVAARLGERSPRHRITVIETGPAVVQGDPGRLEQVLAILLDNAILYSPGGGDVDLSVAVREGHGVVSVRDYGIGIPKERQARIFERFFRAHAGTPHDVGGLGVRLYMSREFVNRLGGQMWFESEEGEGSTFHFSVPLAR